MIMVFFFSSRRRHTRFDCDWSSDVCSSDLRAEGSRGARRGPGDDRHRTGGPDVGLALLRSEEHTSELQSQSNLVCRLLLEKKNKTAATATNTMSASHRHVPCTPLTRVNFTS